MILPVIAYGDPVLRKIGKDIDKDYPNLDKLLADMRDTMLNSFGVGLAAHQVGRPIRLFMVDTEPFADNEDYSEKERAEFAKFKRIFINARITKEEGEEWVFNEGCLSVPNINEDVWRKPNITIEYVDENFEKHKETFSGLIARVIQHEYDHIEGIVFTDKISSFKKRIIKRKLDNITKGNINVGYPMKFPKLKNR
jgi:peptide deformylase